MNWANRLTLSRLGLTILFVIALNSEWPFGRTIALVLFIIAGLTDFADGEIARRYRFVTNFGKLMDPLADKLLITAALVSLVALYRLDAWVAMVTTRYVSTRTTVDMTAARPGLTAAFSVSSLAATAESQPQ